MVEGWGAGGGGYWGGLLLYYHFWALVLKSYLRHKSFKNPSGAEDFPVLSSGGTMAKFIWFSKLMNRA